jgi:hypothetical protein
MIKGNRLHLRILASLGLVTLLILGMHLYDTLNKAEDSAPALQMSRIDFETAVDRSTAEQIKSAIWHMEGVKHVFFNYEDGIVVYAHYPKVLSAQTVFDQITQAYALPASRFIVDAEMAASSCPVTGKSAPIGKLVAGIQSMLRW